MKLKALADRGDFGEANNAVRMLEEFMKANNLTMFDIDDDAFLRSWKIINYEYEVLLSHIIMSVNPFAVIDKKRRKYKVRLDEFDFIEVENKFNYFYDLFLREEKNFIGWMNQNDYMPRNLMYEREKELLLTAFLNFHHEFLVPDQETIMKFRAQRGQMNEEIAQVINPEKELSFEEKKRKAEEDYKNGKFKDVPTFTIAEQRRMEFFRSKFIIPNYVKARKTLQKIN